MSEDIFIFPEAIMNLSQANIPLSGCIAHMIQGENEQVLFMTFKSDVDLAEHVHDAQWGIVLSGRIEMTIGGEEKEYKKGDTYYIPKGIPHSGKIHAGYSDITYFNQKDRYKKK
jgi:quercetin dioxygenase-like cupin family protein